MEYLIKFANVVKALFLNYFYPIVLLGSLTEAIPMLFVTGFIWIGLREYFSSVGGDPNSVLLFVVILIACSVSRRMFQLVLGLCCFVGKKIAHLLKGTRTSLLGQGEKAVGVIKIGGLPMSPSIETLHTLVAGGTGSGKSQVINQFLKTLRDRGDKVLVVDSGGEAMARLFRDGDYLLNPLDSRTVRWSPFSEMFAAHDADRLAKSIIPESESGAEREWQLYSQNLIAALLQRLFEKGGRDATNDRLVKLLTVAKADEIEKVVAGLPAQTLFDTGAAKMLSSVRGIIGSYLPAYRFLAWDTGSEGFSIRKWIQSENDHAWLWVPYRDDQLSSIKSLISCWLGEAVNTTLSLRASNTRRIWIFCDELASLGRIAALADGLTKGRKAGLCLVAGLHSVSQLKTVFGQHETQTLLSCMSTVVCLRAPDADTARYFSESFGKQELLREDETNQKGEMNKGSKTIKHITQDTVLASEISSLKQRTGFVRFADSPDLIHSIEIPICHLGEERFSPFE